MNAPNTPNAQTPNRQPPNAPAPFKVSITHGIVEVPPMLTIYGGPGIGKTTLAASAPDPVFLDLEHGTTDRRLWPERPVAASGLDPWGVVVRLIADSDRAS